MAMSSILPRCSIVKRFFQNRRKTRIEPEAILPEPPSHRTLLTICNHDVVIQLLPGATPRNERLTTSNPLVPHATELLDLDTGQTFITNSPNCYRCSVYGTYDTHMRLCSLYGRHVTNVERECRRRIIELNMDDYEVGTQNSLNKSGMRNKIIRESLRRILELQEEREKKVNKLWTAFHFDWHGAEHSHIGSPATVMSTPMAPPAMVPDVLQYTRPEISYFNKPDFPQDISPRVVQDGIVNEYGPAEGKQKYTEEQLHIEFERGPRGELKRIFLVWKQQKRRRKMVESFRETIYIFPEQKWYTEDDQSLYPPPDPWMRSFYDDDGVEDELCDAMASKTGSMTVMKSS